MIILIKRIKEIISPETDYFETDNNLDFLPRSVRNEYDLKTTENISAHGYDRFARELIEKNREGFVLDCGAGKRPEYLENVVNFEIVPYEMFGIAKLSAAMYVPLVSIVAIKLGITPTL